MRKNRIGKKKDEKKLPPPSEEQKEASPIIIIHGGSNTKAGFGGEKFPRIVLPQQSLDPSKRINCFPLKNDKPTNEEELKNYWREIIEQLGANLLEQPVLLSLPTAKLIGCPFAELAQNFFFKELQATRIAIISDPFLSLVGYQPKLRNLSAIIVDFGLSQLRIVPLYEGQILDSHIVRITFGGHDLTKQLGKWLREQGYKGPTDASFIREIKEKYCFVRPFGQRVTENDSEFFIYLLGDKQFKLDSEIWKIAELFFHKKFFSKHVQSYPPNPVAGEKYPIDGSTLPKAIGYVVKSLKGFWDEEFTPICLTGGGAQFQGLPQRLEDEMKHFFPKLKIRILTTPRMDLLPFIGASKLSRLESFQKFWRTKEDYKAGLFELFV